MKKPYQLFRIAFSAKNLANLFNERLLTTKAVGRDGVRADRFEAALPSEIDLIRRKVLSGSYAFTKYLAKLVSKGARKNPRVLSIPTVRDRLTLRALCEFLSQVYEDDVTKKPHIYIKCLRELLPAYPGGVFLRIDVKDYYPSINRHRLLDIIKKKIRKKEAIHLIRSAIETHTSDDKDEGIPQGLSISNILASVYLRDMDAELSEKYSYFRYVDDILVLCKDRPESDAAFADIQARLSKKYLSCHPLSESGKTCVKNVSDGIDYLGFNVSDKCISIRTSSYNNMFGVILSALTFNKYKEQHSSLIWRLNLKVTGCVFEGKNYGWLFFFMQTENISQLKYLDMFIARQFSSRGLGALTGRVKRFVKAYHEIRFNRKDTKYIPNFDEFDKDAKIRTISLLTGEPETSIRKAKISTINERFYKLIGKEVSKLERDIMETFS
ncbi:MAG: RNA-directed DNA polymerase (reverse transcriptase) protein [Magnetospirillum gryphiswaldense]|nr:RNA-directed DNA polymerase (reverse transcriptase) protein [Magnetospirillum gryphiswaldense]